MFPILVTVQKGRAPSYPPHRTHLEVARYNSLVPTTEGYLLGVSIEDKYSYGHPDTLYPHRTLT